MYSATVIREFQYPHCHGALTGADIIGRAGVLGEGPFMTIYFCTAGDTILRASFETYGCPSAIACGSWITRWVEGKHAHETRLLSPDDLTMVLGGLPLGKEHVPVLAIRALNNAVDQILARRSDAS